MSLSKIQEGLLAKNILSINGDVNGEMVSYVGDSIAILVARGAPDVTILIASGGGSVEAGFDIWDILGLYPGKKTGIAVVQAGSMAVVIMQACDKRLATRNSCVRIHNCLRKIDLGEIKNEARFKKILASMVKDQHRIVQAMSERIGKSVKQIQTQCDKNKSMTAKEALAFGLIDGIHNGPLPGVKEPVNPTK